MGSARIFVGKKKKEKKRKERLWTTGQLITDKIGPSDRGLHAPVRLSGVNLQRVGSDVTLA